jgi:hypothetical protein
MKKNLQKLPAVFLVAIGILCFLPAKSQTELGLKGGILFSDINKGGPDSNLSFERQEGLVFGAFYKRNNLLGRIGFQSEILYQLKGAEVFIKHIDTDTYGYGNEPGNFFPLYYRTQEKLHYVSMPLLFTVPTTKFFELYAGPEFNYLLSKNTNRVESGKFNRFSVGAAVGATVKLGEKTRLDFRYTHDLTSYDDMGDAQNPAKLKNQGFSVTIQQTLFRK